MPSLLGAPRSQHDHIPSPSPQVWWSSDGSEAEWACAPSGRHRQPRARRRRRPAALNTRCSARANNTSRKATPDYPKGRSLGPSSSAVGQLPTRERPGHAIPAVAGRQRTPHRSDPVIPRPPRSVLAMRMTLLASRTRFLLATKPSAGTRSDVPEPHRSHSDAANRYPRPTPAFACGSDLPRRVRVLRREGGCRGASPTSALKCRLGSARVGEYPTDRRCRP